MQLQADVMFRVICLDIAQSSFKYIYISVVQQSGFYRKEAMTISAVRVPGGSQTFPDV